MRMNAISSDFILYIYNKKKHSVKYEIIKKKYKI
jgi:hypothetical protein